MTTVTYDYTKKAEYKSPYMQHAEAKAAVKRKAGELNDSAWDCALVLEKMTKHSQSMSNREKEGINRVVTVLQDLVLEYEAALEAERKAEAAAKPTALPANTTAVKPGDLMPLT